MILSLWRRKRPILVILASMYMMYISLCFLKGKSSFSLYLTCDVDVDVPQVVTLYKTTGVLTYQPINVYTQSVYINSIPNKCDDLKGNHTLNSVIFLVKSAAGNFQRRTTIRETWGQETVIRGTTEIRTVFLLGVPSTNISILDIEEEEERYRDIVFIDYIDSYYNNTYKTVGGINWVVNYCAHVDFVIFVDDDFYIATHQIVLYLQNLSYIQKQTLFTGHLAENFAPQRKSYQKWYCSERDYPFREFPPFASAGTIILSMELLTQIQIAMQYTRHFKFDDVFLGFVLYNLNLKPQHNFRIFARRISYKDRVFHSVLASHGYGDPKDLRKAWQVHIDFIKSVKI